MDGPIGALGLLSWATIGAELCFAKLWNVPRAGVILGGEFSIKYRDVLVSLDSSGSVLR